MIQLFYILQSCPYYTFITSPTSLFLSLILLMVGLTPHSLSPCPAVLEWLHLGDPSGLLYMYVYTRHF